MIKNGNLLKLKVSLNTMAMVVGQMVNAIKL